MKTANLLYNNEGYVKIADFGLARVLKTNNYHTQNVVTLWYRSPELLLGANTYDSKIDIWSVGCIFAEMILGETLFKSDSEAKQII